VQLPRFVPEDLRQLARFVPARGWDAIEWKPLLGSLKSVSWRFVSGSGVAGLRDGLPGLDPGVDLREDLDGLRPLAAVEGPRVRKRCGDALLRLYFAQWLNEDGLFLDLRSQRFAVDGQALVFAPNGLWVQLRPVFREGMADIYRGFYSGDEALLERALLDTGMLRKDLPAAARDELFGLLRQHFGICQSRQPFAIDSFKASFDELFDFFLAHDYTLHSDFVWVGFYLITLYLTLEEGGQAHDVRAICEETLLRG
jgi:predicted unusual protein kinase regulating ubiquinone biosynthesis (AarF/ABC1/UbiB family)